MPGSRRSLARPVGVLCLAVGVVVSRPVLEATMFPAGAFAPMLRGALLLGFDLTMLALGMYLLVWKPRLTVVHLAALGLGGSLAAIGLSAVLQLTYRPPLIVSGWRAFAPPAEQNELGFRGRRIVYRPDDYVVVLLGDSQVEAMALAFDAMPERLLEARLDVPGRRVRVFSLGAGAYGNDQELLVLQEYLQKYRADMVVLRDTPTNDIWNNLFNVHMASRNPKPTFWLDRSGHLQGPAEAMGQPLANSRIVPIALFQRAFGLPWREERWERSLPEPYRPLDRYDGPVRTEWQRRWETNLGRMRDEELDTEMSHMAVSLTPRSPRMQYGLDLTRALIQRIDATISANRGRLVVLQTVTGSAESGAEEVYVLNGKYYRTSARQARANWEYVNKGFDVELVPVTVAAWRVSTEDAHLNRVATEQVMTDLAARLRPRIAGTPPPAATR